MGDDAGSCVQLEEAIRGVIAEKKCFGSMEAVFGKRANTGSFFPLTPHKYHQDRGIIPQDVVPYTLAP